MPPTTREIWEAGFAAAKSVAKIAASVADMSTDPVLSLQKLPEVIEDHKEQLYGFWEEDQEHGFVRINAPCDAYLWHGPGHQSRTRCRVKGEHEIHEAEYGGGVARWKDGSYTDGLRAKGIDFDPESYPENMAMTGYFNEPPEEPGE
jgi:hypothetical protein